MPNAPDQDLPAGISNVLRLVDLPQRKPTRFSISPDAAVRAAIATALDISDLRKLRFEGSLRPVAGRDWRLEAQLGATVVQPCSITLDPVVTRIEEDVQRHYTDAPILPETADPTHEVEMPEDDTLDPLPDSIDLGEVLMEALALALPAFPRSANADLGEIRAAPADTDPLDDTAMKPFAGLASLRNKLEGKE